MPILDAVAGYEREDSREVYLCVLQNAYLRACVELQETIGKHTRHEAAEEDVAMAEKAADNAWAEVERYWKALDGVKE